MKTEILLNKLRADVLEIITATQELQSALNTTALNYKTAPDSWSALECFDHLNRYATFYLPEIEKAISKNRRPFINEEVKYSWIGAYSIKMVHPGNKKKQKTFRRMNPANSELGADVIKQFLSHQANLHTLIDCAASVNINSGKVSVEFLKLLKMNIGESIEFVLAHQQRHLQQAKNVVRASPLSNPPILVL